MNFKNYLIRFDNNLSWGKLLSIIKNFNKNLIQKYRFIFIPNLQPKDFIEFWIYFMILLSALFTRFWDLGIRPMHHDESIHAISAWNLFTQGIYNHHPMVHGPFQIEATSLLFLIFGDSDFTARILYAFAGTILVMLPILLRPFIGRYGALVASLLLLISPSLLYYSRFARNDILMCLWTLSLFTVVWRYIKFGKDKYLYLSTLFLVALFCTKENAYFTVFIMCSYIGYGFISVQWQSVSKSVSILGKHPHNVFFQWSYLLFNKLYFGVKNSVSRKSSITILVFALTLPLTSGFIGLLQDWIPFILISSTESTQITGLPVGGGVVIAFLIILILFSISFLLGWQWNKKKWVVCFLIFWVVWIALYTTGFSNWNGISSGLWQSVGYWIVQQDVGRGAQPMYYYFVIGLLYDFLPMLFSLVALIYYWGKRDTFAKFLLFWVVSSALIYTFASEKMPWLLVHMTLPMIMISGKFLGEQFNRLGIISSLLNGKLEFSKDRLKSFIVASVFIVLFLLTLRASLIANFLNSAIPVEMLVYTATTPDISDISNTVSVYQNDKTENFSAFQITVDETSGFAWPWVWYFRNNTNVSYTSLNNISDTEQFVDQNRILLVHEQNRFDDESFWFVRKIKHRWWFPENETYRNITFGQLLKGSLDQKTRNRAFRYFLYRDMPADIGSENAYLYIPKNFIGVKHEIFKKLLFEN